MNAATRLSLRVATLLAIATAANAQYTVYRSDIEEMNRKLVMGLQFAHQMWSEMSRNIRAPYGPPGVEAFRGGAITPCTSEQEPGRQAFYCPRNNTIYYDELWLLGEMRQSGADVGTDGDVGAIVVLLHEFGHAIHHMWQITVADVHQGPDMVADCLAGATLRGAAEDGHLEAGDIQEAESSLKRAGADRGQLSAGQAASMGSHGPGWLRVQRFRLGYNGGVRVCMQMLENARSVAAR
jgi:predicted metalloprotease